MGVDVAQQLSLQVPFFFFFGRRRGVLVGWEVRLGRKRQGVHFEVLGEGMTCGNRASSKRERGLGFSYSTFFFFRLTL